MCNYNNLRMWADSEQPQPLYLPNHDCCYINCILSSMSELDVSTWYKPIEVVFVAYDPYFYGIKHSQLIGKSFSVICDAEVPFKIECDLTQSVSNPSWQIDSMYTIELLGSVGVGALVVDTERKLVTLNGDSINAQISMATRFHDLKPGKHTIIGTAGTVSWIERWK